jgi:uncharacterized protein YggU (UPF0235/DUF167 family)
MQGGALYKYTVHSLSGGTSRNVLTATGTLRQSARDITAISCRLAVRTASPPCVGAANLHLNVTSAITVHRPQSPNVTVQWGEPLLGAREFARSNLSSMPVIHTENVCGFLQSDSAKYGITDLDYVQHNINHPSHNVQTGSMAHPA